MFSEQLKSQLDIVDVVGQYVRLKRQGAGPRYVGLCPFHADKTPSFNVHSGLQIYKCFACDVSGDVFQFIMDRENLTFPETLRFLADRYGIPMPERHRVDDPEAQRRAALFEMHEIAAELFQQNLRNPGGSKAREYLESRGITPAMADEFRLGFSDGSGQQLAGKLQRFGGSLLEESGLVLKRQEGSGYFDRFRGRLMFPIHNEGGQVIGFGGRALRQGDEPKYLNSPETKLYKKSSVLYNLHRAKIDARKNDRMILVEGYMDVIGVYSAGIREVVASSGTALSNEQVRSIKRQVSQQHAGAGQIVLNFDGDSAGMKSTEKYIGALLAEGLRVRVLEIPGGRDPDEYIRENGAEAYRKLLNQAGSYFHWLADRMRQRFDLHSADGRADALKGMAPVLQLVTDKVERGAILSELAEYLNMDRDVVRDSLRPAKRTAATAKPQTISSSVPSNEKILLACLLLSEQSRTAIRQYLRHTDALRLLELRTVFEALLATPADVPFSISAISERLDARMQRILTELSFAELDVGEENALTHTLNCLRVLETKLIESRRDDLKQQIRYLEKAGDFAEAIKLTLELDNLKRSLPEP
jgi:DNA primase